MPPQEPSPQPQPEKSPLPKSGNSFPWAPRPNAAPDPTAPPNPSLPPSMPQNVKVPPPQPGQIVVGDTGTPPTAKKPPRSKLFWIAATLIIAVIVLGSILGLVFWQTYEDEPGRILKLALDNALASAQVQTQTTATGVTTKTQYNLSFTNHPQLSTGGTITLYGSKFGLKSYGTLTNGYIAYTGVPAGVDSATRTAVLNKWVQLRQNGTLPSGVSQELTNNFDTRAALFGPLPLGDFSLPSRTTLVNDLLQTGVYTYRTAQVKKSSLDGTRVYVYSASENVAALTNFYKAIAASEGLSASAVTATMQALYTSAPATATLYIQPSTHQILRLDFAQGGHTRTLVYQYGQSSVAASPTKSIAWKEFVPDQEALEKQAALQQSNNQLDSERVSDVNLLQSYIEAYQINSGQYPTLADLNDQVWVSSNMQGIDPSTFKDPAGTSTQLAATPTAAAYAYAPLGAGGVACNDESNSQKDNVPCVSYTLTATLSNGNLYAVQSLH